MIKEKTIAERLVRARQLLNEIHHVAIATVNEDGSPHNSPVFMAFDDRLRAFWASNQDSQHSRNIARDGRVFLVIFDSRQGHIGGADFFAGANPQRIYQAEPLKFWINASERNDQGVIIRDSRIEISAQQLLDS